jgi:hypothetical protein
VKEDLARSVESNNATLREVDETREERDAAVQKLAELEGTLKATYHRLEAAERQLAVSREEHQAVEVELRKELTELLLGVERAGI